MPITFSFCHEENYVIVVYSGRFADVELLESWKELYECKEWVPGLNELLDCSQVNGTDVTNDGLQRLTKYANVVFSKHGISSVKVAIYAPKNISFGMSRVYEAMSCESSETVRIFKSMQEAVSWIKGSKKNSCCTQQKSRRTLFNSVVY